MSGSDGPQLDLGLIITAAGVFVALFIGIMQVFIAYQQKKTADRQAELSRLQGELQARQGEIQAVSSWLPFLVHKDSNVRLAAVIAIGRIEAESAIAPLVTALTDDDATIRERAGAALAKLVNEENATNVGDIVASIFEKQEPENAQAALDTLVRIGLPALARIQAALQKPLSPEARRQAERAIQRILLNEQVLQKIGVLESHKMTLGSSDVLVAIVGAGVDRSVPDIAAALVDEADHVGDAGGPGFSTTWAARLIVGQPDSEFLGVAPDVRLLSERALSAQGRGSSATVAEGVRHATGSGAKVIYLELGGPTYDEALQQAINEAKAAGIIVIAAAGNANDEAKSYPAAMENVVAVAATDGGDRKAPYSSYGDWVDISAPGNPVLGQEGSFAKTAGIQALQGTSFSGGLVAGAAALVWSVDPSMPAESVLKIILETAADLDARNPDYRGKLGTGRLDVLKAVKRAAVTTRASALPAAE